MKISILISEDGKSQTMNLLLTQKLPFEESSVIRPAFQYMGFMDIIPMILFRPSLKYWMGFGQLIMHLSGFLKNLVMARIIRVAGLRYFNLQLKKLPAKLFLLRWMN